MNKGRSLFQERLVGLYLRLNGYFQTGYFPHSDESGNIGTDVDRLAVRFPGHDQSEREIGSCPALQIPADTIDIILAEVKNSEKKFNDSIKSGGRRVDENWSQILRWTGLFESHEIEPLIEALKGIVDKDGATNNEKFEMALHNNKTVNVSIRPIIFSIESPHSKGENKKFINGTEMIQYIWQCLCPPSPRIDCSTRYPFASWGFE